jgi:hypothetical protein
LSELLLYRYHPGQVLTFEQSQSMLFTDPEKGRAAGRSVTRSIQKILESHPDSSWTIELTQHIMSQEGVLKSDLAQELMSQPVQFRMNAHGAMVDPSGTVMAGTTSSFPSHPVNEGDSWTPEGDQLGVVFMLRAFEKKGDDLVALLSSTMAVENSDDGSRTTCESTFSFSLTGGYHLSSHSVTETTWQDGRMVQNVIENRLLEVSAL